MSAFESGPASFERFPSFRALFEPEPRYLSLLHLPSDEGLWGPLEAALAQSPDAPAEIAALLGDRNHRCHLVGGAALVLLAPSERGLEALWAALDAGTWAAAQLTAIAFVLDARFEERARARLLSGAGHPKTLAALGALYRRLPSPRLAVIARLADPQLAGPEGKDGAHYAGQWLERLVAVSPPEARARFVRSSA